MNFIAVPTIAHCMAVAVRREVGYGAEQNVKNSCWIREVKYARDKHL